MIIASLSMARLQQSARFAIDAVFFSFPFNINRFNLANGWLAGAYDLKPNRQSGI